MSNVTQVTAASGEQGKVCWDMYTPFQKKTVEAVIQDPNVRHIVCTQDWLVWDRRECKKPCLFYFYYYDTKDVLHLLKIGQNRITRHLVTDDKGEAVDLPV